MRPFDAGSISPKLDRMMKYYKPRLDHHQPLLHSKSNHYPVASDSNNLIKSHPNKAASFTSNTYRDEGCSNESQICNSNDINDGNTKSQLIHLYQHETNQEPQDCHLLHTKVVDLKNAISLPSLNDSRSKLTGMPDDIQSNSSSSSINSFHYNSSKLLSKNHSSAINIKHLDEFNLYSPDEDSSNQVGLSIRLFLFH